MLLDPLAGVVVRGGRQQRWVGKRELPSTSLGGTTAPFDAATLAALYPGGVSEWREAFATAVDEAVERGIWLEPEAENFKAASEQITAVRNGQLATRRETDDLRQSTEAKPQLDAGERATAERLANQQSGAASQTKTLSGEEISRLFDSTRHVLAEWFERLKHETGDDWPEKVTAFRPEMAVHGKHKQPCPVCGSPVQRIVHADNETNYCARCQTGGKLLADRSLSRLLKEDWPATLEELDEYVASRGSAR